ncbi:hypothetical protein [Cytobacillus firmus]|uniref:hypothetical protein n=1 Tax=Cytobacillus firmus TaxID=1399 RepID=UPI0024C1F407|nr:hypothetical protein [Cytobacillus firmus]WHY63660.1 hypothetical protein QNH42_09940 [Cytobacillus firmus]
MAEITNEDLLNEGILLEKLKANHERFKEAKRQHEEILKRQTEIFQQRIEELKPVMKFLYDSNFMFSHPTLKIRSGRGAVLDFDEKNQESYVFDIESDWIKKINMYDKDRVSTVPTWQFVEQRNVENAINGLNSLLTFQDKIVNDYQKSIDKRQRWIEENS